MRQYRIRKWLLCLAFLPALGAFAQRSTAAVDSLFYRGVTAYQNGQYQQSLDVMRMLDQLYPNHGRTTGSLLMQGKALYQLKQYPEAIRHYERLIKDHASSAYGDDALFGLGQVFTVSGHAVEAARSFLQVVEQGRDTDLKRKAAAYASDLLDLRLTVPDLKELLSSLRTERSRATVTIKLARREMDEHRFMTAKHYLEDHLGRYPGGSYNESIRQMLSQAEALSQGQMKIGVILPLTGPTAEDGKVLLEGLQFAARRASQSGQASIRLIVKDSGGEMVQAIRAAQALCADREISALVGELESDITAAIAAVAQERGVPLLAPTATKDGIADIGDFIFQLSATFSIQAETVARYAVIDQGLRRFALLYPYDQIGIASRDAFVRTVEAAGGEILVEKHYFGGDSNWENYIGTQLKAMRRAGLERMVADSLIHFIPKEEWDEAYENLGDIHYVTSTLEDLVDSTRVGVTSIDGVFLPVYDDEVIYVSPHLFKQNFATAQIFGGQYWNQPELLLENRDFVQQTEGMIFPAESYIDPDQYAYYEMVNAYRTAKNRTPGDLEILGVDIIQLLTKIGEGKSVNRNQIRDAILEARRFQGIRAPLVFGDNGANTYVHLLRYRNGRLLKIK